MSQAIVKGTEKTVINKNGIIGLGSSPGIEYNEESLERSGDFSRAVIGQSFQVVSYTPGEMHGYALVL